MLFFNLDSGLTVIVVGGEDKSAVDVSFGDYKKFVDVKIIFN